MKTMSEISRDQMELSLDRTNQSKPAARRPRRFSKARWWFAQMHHVVDEALDWGPSPPARPAQTDLSLGSCPHFAGLPNS